MRPRFMSPSELRNFTTSWELAIRAMNTEHPYMEFLCVECGTEAELELEED